MSTDRSKMVFANALLELADKKSLADITVSDITEHCNLSRTSFYYHFKDKQELVYWIYTAFRDKRLKVDANHSRNNIITLVKYMQDHHTFFKQAFAENGQNCFKNEYRQSLLQDTLTIMEDNNDCEHLDMESRRLIASFFANATVDAVESLLDAPTKDVENAADVLTEILKSSWTVIENLKGTVDETQKMAVNQ